MPATLRLTGSGVNAVGGDKCYQLHSENVQQIGRGDSGYSEPIVG